MSRFRINDLQYHYTWSPATSSFADYNQLNHTHGFEMLHFINRFMEENRLYTVASGQKIERLLREQMPGQHSVRYLYRWLRKQL
ncbi:hypothetical protein [Deminuibacter soli]|uniref:Uncharacterized protein n=1 Tax=Deminuibacter soli TaxID=2291815 RepID=A0A3E1NM15_9BACT|nr:hypothetical protein [Deminuibacter soli]RFM28858.1 hypothetical protein DXN05_08790 [Deminuibacter soli]